MIALDVHSTTKLLDWTTQSVNVKRKFIQEKSVSPVKKIKSNITKKSRK
jgi:hypothetical protein